MVKLAKRLKKEKVNVDIVNFGEDEVNQKKLLEFIESVNGKDGTGSHLVTVPPGTVLHESLASSPIIAGEDGSGALPGSGIGLEFGLDAVDDPDLIYALRVSMEDQRMRQEQEASANSGGQSAAVLPGSAGTSEEELLRQALAMSMQVGSGSSGSTSGPVDLANMTEEEQIAYAIQMSMQTQEQERASDEKKSDSEVSFLIHFIISHYCRLSLYSRNLWMVFVSLLHPFPLKFTETGFLYLTNHGIATNSYL